MINRTLQEIADFFDCEVEINPNSGTAALWKNEEGDRAMVCIGELVLKYMLPSNGDLEKIVYWPDLSAKPTGSEGSSKTAITTNAPHQSEVHTHKEYKILSEKLYSYGNGYGIDSLSRKITKLLNEGWMPYGDPIISANKDDWTVYQAMVRGIEHER